MTAPSLKNKPVRFSKKELQKRVEFIIAKEVCQVCEENTYLDYPHHAVYGWSSKDDRTLVNICISCHTIIHTKGYDILPKTRKEVEAIGWANDKEYNEQV